MALPGWPFAPQWDLPMAERDEPKRTLQPRGLGGGSLRHLRRRRSDETHPAPPLRMAERLHVRRPIVCDQMCTDLIQTLLQVPLILHRWTVELMGLQNWLRRGSFTNGIPGSEPLAADKLAVHCSEDHKFPFSSISHVSAVYLTLTWCSVVLGCVQLAEIVSYWWDSAR